jgi:hypothetical protein
MLRLSAIRGPRRPVARYLYRDQVRISCVALGGAPLSAFPRVNRVSTQAGSGQRSDHTDATDPVALLGARSRLSIQSATTPTLQVIFLPWSRAWEPQDGDSTLADRPNQVG